MILLIFIFQMTDAVVRMRIIYETNTFGFNRVKESYESFVGVAHTTLEVQVKNIDYNHHLHTLAVKNANSDYMSVQIGYYAP